MTKTNASEPHRRAGAGAPPHTMPWRLCMAAVGIIMSVGGPADAQCTAV